MEALRGFSAELRLRVNEDESAVARVRERKFLSYSFWVDEKRAVRLRLAPKALEGLKQRVREITRRNGGRGMEQVCEVLGSYLRGWRQYFALVETPGVCGDLDGWIHRRLRALQLKQWR